MTPSETVILTRYVAACCPQQAIDEYTPDAWHDLLADLDAADCRAAVAAVVKRQPFVAVAEIRAEVKRIRRDRIAREIVPAPPPELTDQPGRYKAAIEAGIQRIANGLSVQRAIAGPVRDGSPPAEWTEARNALGEALEGAAKPPSPQETARRQAAESRAARGASEPESGESAA